MVSDDQIRLGEEFTQDPHGLYAQLRVSGPVREVVLPSGVRGWLLTSYADVRVALADPRLSKNYSAAMPLFARNTEPSAGAEPANFGTELVTHMLNTDPPPSGLSPAPTCSPS